MIVCSANQSGPTPKTPWTIAIHVPPSMGISRKEYWSRLPFPSPGDLPDPGNEPPSFALAGKQLTIEPSGKPQDYPLLMY